MSENDDDLDPELRELLGMEPQPDPTAERVAAAQKAVTTTSGAPKRKVRVGPLETVHDVRHEATRLYRAIRTAEIEDLSILLIAPHAIRALKLVLDATKNAELEEEILNIRRLLAGKAPRAPKANGRTRINGAIQ